MDRGAICRNTALGNEIASEKPTPIAGPDQVDFNNIHASIQWRAAFAEKSPTAIPDFVGRAEKLEYGNQALPIADIDDVDESLGRRLIQQSKPVWSQRDIRISRGPLGAAAEMSNTRASGITFVRVAGSFPSPPVSIATRSSTRAIRSSGRSLFNAVDDDATRCVCTSPHERSR